MEVLIHLAQAYKANNEKEKVAQLLNGLTKAQQQKWQKQLNAL